jgi:cyclopropane-fatty-acyl-phospholipid synthase
MASQADIAQHYDVDNDFFALFLDKKFRAYSCGVWRNATSLEQAQEEKFNRLCHYANVGPNQHVIEIGCGWGGLMNNILDHYSNTKVHGLTLSQEQFEYINSALRPNLSIDLQSWQDYAVPEQKFDSIITIGAFEHFASFEDQSKSLIGALAFLLLMHKSDFKLLLSADHQKTSLNLEIQDIYLRRFFQDLHCHPLAIFKLQS